MLEPFHSVGHQENVAAVALSSDGSLAASSTFEDVLVWQTSNGKVVRRLEGDGYDLAFANDDRLAVGGNRRTTVYHVQSGAVLAQLEPYGNSVEGVAFSARGDLLATASHDGTLKVFPTRPADMQRRILTTQWRLLQKFCLGNWVNGCAFHPRHDQLAVCSREGTLRVIDPWNARQLFLTEGPTLQNWPVSVAYSPDGLILASGWSDGSVRLYWNVDFSTAGVFEGHHDWVRGLAFLDNEHLATGSHDGFLSVWSWQSRRRQVHLDGHEGQPVYALCACPQRRLLLSGGWDKRARLWTY